MADIVSGNTGHIAEHNRLRKIPQWQQRLDSFDGADDDAKLAAAISYVGSQTYPPDLVLDRKGYTWTDPIGQIPDGLHIVGPGAGWMSSASARRNHDVLLNTGGTPFITISNAETWNTLFKGIYFRSTDGNTQFAKAPSGKIVWAATFDNLSFKGFKGVLGTSAEAFATDLITIKGQWSVLTCYDTPFNIRGGDDTALWNEGMNIGSGDDPSGGGGKFLMMFSTNSKYDVGPIYLTADNDWRGVKHLGSMSGGFGASYNRMRIEGRNPGDPCAGNLVLVTGGASIWRDINLNSGMASPSAGEHGLFEINGTDTQVAIDGLFVAHATGVAVTTPVVYISGTPGQVSLSIRNVMRCLRGGSPSWGSQLPVVRQSVAGLVTDYDSSIQLVTG